MNVAVYRTRSSDLFRIKRHGVPCTNRVQAGRVKLKGELNELTRTFGKVALLDY